MKKFQYHLYLLLIKMMIDVPLIYCVLKKEVMFVWVFDLNLTLMAHFCMDFCNY